MEELTVDMDIKGSILLTGTKEEIEDNVEFIREILEDASYNIYKKVNSSLFLDYKIID